MDWDRVIERNVAALKRILAALAVMAGNGASTLPRIVHRAVLRLLRPAESAARRLVIVFARDMVVTLSRRRPGKRTPAPTIPRYATTIPDAAPKTLSLPLLDPLRRSATRTTRFRGPGSSGVPRILFPGVTEPFPVKPWRPPSPDDPIDAARLVLRLGALASALDDLPAQARRFARWRARRDALLAKERETGDVRARRMTPFRPGRPPGVHRPGARRPAGEVDDVVRDLHYFAHRALAPPDTS